MNERRNRLDYDVVIPCGELIHAIVAALAKRMTVHELAALTHYHPTPMKT